MRRCHAPIARSFRGRTHGGVRWKMFSSFAFAARCGMNWIALAPVPSGDAFAFEVDVVIPARRVEARPLKGSSPGSAAASSC